MTGPPTGTATVLCKSCQDYGVELERHLLLSGDLHITLMKRDERYT